MPLFDYTCATCGHTREMLAAADQMENGTHYCDTLSKEEIDEIVATGVPNYTGRMGAFTRSSRMPAPSLARSGRYSFGV